MLLRNFLQTIRKNPVINRTVRQALKILSKSSAKLTENAMSHWPTAGPTGCNFEEYSFKLHNNCDDGLASTLFYDRKYQEENDLHLFLTLCKQSKTIVDIGANTGLFSILAAKANPFSQIFSIEPYAINANRLLMNLQLNNITNVTVITEALGSNTGKIEFNVPADGRITDVSSTNKKFSESYYPEIKWQSQVVKINTLDGFRQQIKTPIELIKCDVEGHEMEVFKGAEKTLREDRPTIIFESFYNGERAHFFNRILREQGYYLYLILEQGVVYCKEGFIETNYGLNYLITPVKPKRTFISYKDKDTLVSDLMRNPTPTQDVREFPPKCKAIPG